MFKDEIALTEPANLPQPTRYRRQRPRARSQAQKKSLMKAAAIDHFGSPAALKLRLVPSPKAGSGEVLIALHAAGVGVWDTEMRGGWWPGKRPKFPLVLGTDGAGTVAALGPGVRRFRMGQQVWAYEFLNHKGGFYAEHVVVKADNVGRVPRRLDLVHAGASAVTGLTALQGIDDHLRLRKGETVLIFGATGAVGTLAIQFAKRHSACVIATASSRQAKMLVRRLGADGVFDARSKNALEELRALAPGELTPCLRWLAENRWNAAWNWCVPAGVWRIRKGLNPSRESRRIFAIYLIMPRPGGGSLII